ncbi:MAG: class I SAM-dependent methyltransferase [Candidatus Saccharimonadales bacterium]
MSKYSENIPDSILGSIGWFIDDIPQNSIVLDVGCSTGYFGSYIKKHKNSIVYGIEISDDRYKAEKVLDKVYSFDLDSEWPKEVYEQKYDVIFLGDVIEHLKDPKKFLIKLHDLINKDGRVYISTPNVAHISTRLELLGGNFEYEDLGILDSTHLKYFTLNSLTNLIHEAGFEIIRMDSSENDYPREVIQKILKSYGLKANNKFWEMIAEPTARAYQFKLVLKVGAQSTARIIKLPKKPEQYKTDFLDIINKQLEQYKTEADDIKKKYVDLYDDYIDVSNTLSKLVNSKAYKISKKMQKIKNKTTEVLRGKK